MAWLEKLDKRAARWPAAMRWPYLGLRWFLIALGTYCLIGLYVQRWGWMAATWFLIAPFAYGVWSWSGWSTLHRAPPGQSPQQH